jgi:hypothetical protein
MNKQKKESSLVFQGSYVLFIQKEIFYMGHG